MKWITPPKGLPEISRHPRSPHLTLVTSTSLGLPDFSQVELVGMRYNCVNFAAKDHQIGEVKYRETERVVLPPPASHHQTSV